MSNQVTWTHGTFNKYFQDGAPPYPIQIDIDDYKVKDESEWAWLRVNGPSSEELPGIDYLTVNIDVVIQTQPEADSLYGITEITDHFANLFISTIPAYRHGPPGPLNDGSFWGCYQLQGGVSVKNFGRPDVGVNILQASISAQYRMEI